MALLNVKSLKGVVANASLSSMPCPGIHLKESFVVQHGRKRSKEMENKEAEKAVRGPLPASNIRSPWDQLRIAENLDWICTVNGRCSEVHREL